MGTLKECEGVFYARACTLQIGGNVFFSLLPVRLFEKNLPANSSPAKARWPRPLRRCFPRCARVALSHLGLLQPAWHHGDSSSLSTQISGNGRSLVDPVTVQLFAENLNDWAQCTLMLR